MSVRFRVKTRDGREIQVETLEALVEMVRAGSVRPEDLVFDSVTGEWAPARTHSLVRQATESVEETAGSGAGKMKPDQTEEISSDLPSFDILEPEPTSAEAETESLIAELEQERGKDENPLSHVAPDATLWVPGSDSTLVLEPGRRRGSRRTSVSRPLPPVHDRTSPVRSTPVPRRPDRGRRDWLLALVLPVVALLASVAVARPEFRANAAETAAGDADETRRPVSASEEQIRSQAYAGFVDAVDGLAATFEFGTVPEAWLEGWYLAEPSAYPEVREFWQRFRSYVETARAEEGRLYREAYLNAAERARVTGPLRSLRMAAALEDFEAGAAARTEHYRRVLELADAALSLDGQLLEVEGQISYEPARGQRLSADPVIEAAGRDPETQARLEAALDRVLRAVYRSGAEGVRDRTHLARWLVDGLRPFAPDGGTEPTP